MFMITATRIRIPLELFYTILVVLLAIQALFFERDNPGDRVIDTSQYSFTEAPRQVLAAVLVVLPFGSLFVVFSARPATVFGEGFLDQLITQAVFVSFVETVYMIVIVRTLWHENRNVGILAWPVIFAFMHPVVRENWILLRFPLESFLGFAYAAVFGILFWILWEGRERLPRRYRGYFGAVTSWTAHLLINLIVIAFPLTVFVLELFPLRWW